MGSTPIEGRNARRYLSGLGLSVLGDSAMSLVAGIWVKTITGSSIAAGLVSACAYAPTLLSPLAGLFADRTDPRRLIIRCELVMAAVMSTLLLVHGRAEVWLIFSVMTAYGCAVVLIDPAESSLLTALFRPAVRAHIGGIRMALQEGAKLVAPLAGAAVFVAVGGGVVAAADAITFAVAAVATTLVRAPAHVRTTTTRGRLRVELLAGIRHVATTAPLRRAAVLASVAIAISGPLVTAQYDLVAAVHRPPAFFAVFTAALGAGSIVAGLVSGRLINRYGELTVIALGLGNGVIGDALRSTGILPVALVGSVVMGFALPWVAVATVVLAQRLTPADRQGRVASALTLAMFGPLPVVQAVGSVLVGPLGYRWMFAGTAGVQLVLLGATLLRPPVDQSTGDRSSRQAIRS